MLKGFFAGMIFATIICLGTAVYAAENIKVELDKIEVIVNGNVVKGHNILYNGRTYVPLREISEILDKQVDWLGRDNIVLIQDKTND